MPYFLLAGVSAEVGNSKGSGLKFGSYDPILYSGAVKGS